MRVCHFLANGDPNGNKPPLGTISAQVAILSELPAPASSRGSPWKMGVHRSQKKRIPIALLVFCQHRDGVSFLR